MKRIAFRTLAGLVSATVLVGCVTDAYQGSRFRMEAVNSRCGGPTVQQLTTLPRLPVPPGSMGSGQSVKSNFSPRASRMAEVLGLESFLADLPRSESEAKKDVRQNWPLLWRYQQVMDRISLASFDVMSTVTELDCEEARADHVAAGLTEIRQDKQERGLFLALVGDALIGVVAGALSLAGKSTASAANAILGGALATGLGGAATVFLTVDHPFQHPRNHLAELWIGTDESALFPDSVWLYLNSPNAPTGRTIRQDLIDRWEKEGRFGPADEPETADRRTLLLGEGGTYGIRDLRIRAEMLDHLKSAVLGMAQDLNVLIYELMAETMDYLPGIGE